MCLHEHLDLLVQGVEGLAERPEAANLLNMFAALTDRDIASVCAEYAGQPFSAFKADLAECAVARLSPIFDEVKRMRDDPAYVDGVLAAGAERARALAEPVLRDVYRTVGFLGA